MAQTLQETITSAWKQVSTGDCTIQSETASTMYEVAVGDVEPIAGSLLVKLDEPANFAYKSPVWLRLHAKGSAGQQRVVNVIKESAV